MNQAGDGPLLRQAFVHRAGHCAFTPAETVAAVRVLLNRLDTGRWDQAALGPASLNQQAAALGPGFNPLPPAFEQFSPPQYLRPFDLGDPVP